MGQDFDREISRIYGEICSHGYSDKRMDVAWFDGDCRRAFELRQSAYRR